MGIKSFGINPIHLFEVNLKLFRYLAKEVLVSTAAVSFILLLIISSGRFISYLGQAAEGKMSFKFLFIILGYNIPNFLQLILPLAFFLSLLLTYGRLYIENEMSILFSSGVSKVKLLGYTLGISLIALTLNGLFSIWLTPASEYHSKLAKQEQSQLTAFDFIQPGQFQGNGRKTTYVAAITPEEGWMNDVFITEISKKDGKNIAIQTLADYAEQIDVKDENNSTYLVLKNGSRFEGTPGENNYRITDFDTYAILLADAEDSVIDDLSTQPSSKLWSIQSFAEQAEWQWRLSLIIMIPILTVIATSLSQVNPRQGRFFKLLPATLLMIFYLAMLIWGKGALEKGKTPLMLGLWWVHILFAAIAIFLFMNFNDFSIMARKRKPNKTKQIESATE